LSSGLDIGCGGASPLTDLRSRTFASTGIDVDARAIQTSRANQTHDRYIVGDFMALDLREAFDVVVLSHVIEHFERDRGMEVLRRVETTATRLLYVETPFGFFEQDDYDGNPFQRHLSGWFPNDFESRGYTVYGSGPRWLRRPMGRPKPLPEPLMRSIERSLQWFYFTRPQRAATISAIRFKDAAGNLRRV
jgi:hypothetical protein